MKNLLLVVLLLTAATKAVAQWNQGSPFNTTTQVTNGNVGIGHTSPQSRLLVRTTTAHQGLVISNCDSNGTQTHFALTTADQARAGLATESYFNIYNSGKWMFNSGNTSGGTTLPISFSTDGANRLYIKPDGNIGVGTATPWSPLTIEPGQLTLANNIGTNYTEVAALNFANRAISGASGTSNNARISVQTAGNHFSSSMSFHVRSGNAAYEAMRIMPDGSVGIGTVSPTAKLHIQQGQDDGGEQLRIGRGSGAVRFVQENNKDNLYLYNSDASKLYMVWKENGNVGIGSTSPDAKLTVKGTVHAEEVKIDLNVPGPDYVFDAAYNLPSLEELNAYIKINRHLPEVPSACAMEENGVNLGEMNMLLLKKVEELTLYVIEQSKEAAERKTESESLRDIIKQQNERISNLEHIIK